MSSPLTRKLSHPLTYTGSGVYWIRLGAPRVDDPRDRGKESGPPVPATGDSQSTSRTLDVYETPEAPVE